MSQGGLSTGALLLAAGVMLGGCVEHPDGRLQLRWRFADGRDCSASGVGSVGVEVRQGARVVFADAYGCLDGAQGVVEVGEFSGKRVALQLQAFSFEGALLYAQEQEVVLVPGERVMVEITLISAGLGR
ncbi:MAG: hypothetical protein AAFS10_25075 [Myxococcota bacterium]